MKKHLSSLVLIGLMLSGCVVDDPSTSEVSANVGTATITTDMATYTYNSTVTVTWSGMPTNATDWVAIAPAGSAMTSVTRWAYTGGAASGSAQLSGPATGGSYVARGFSNDTYTLEGESAAFTVQDPSGTQAVLTPDSQVYTMTQPITITWSGLPGNLKDWIAIAPAGGSTTNQAEWRYTGGGTSGVTVFTDGLQMTGYPAGSYVARAYLNDTFTLVGESAAFTIGSGITTNKGTYTVQEAITVTWSGLPTNPQDWVALAPAGSANSTVTQWVYTGGVSGGMHTFGGGLASTGSYVARAFLNGGYTLLGESAPFTVTALAAAGITTDAQTYALGAFVTVSWSGLPTNMLDWISIAPVGSSDSTTTRWVYTGGASMGSAVFEGPPTTGTYEARAFLNDTYTKLGTSLPFVVQ